MHRKRSLPARRVVAAAVATTLVLAATFVSTTAAGADATDSNSADLSLNQTFALNTAPGDLRVAAHVTNAGPAEATNVTLVALMRTSDSLIAVLGQPGARCQIQTPPAHWDFMFTCEDTAPLAVGATWHPHFTVSDDAGAELTSRMSVGAENADPNDTNTASTLRAGFGAADLGVTQAASAGPTTGTATIMATIRNRGPLTATSLEYRILVASPTVANGQFSGNQPGTVCTGETAPEGYQLAETCVLGSLAPRASWVVTAAYTGGPGQKLQQDGSVSNSMPDPDTTNNSTSTKSAFAS